MTRRHITLSALALGVAAALTLALCARVQKPRHASAVIVWRAPCGEVDIQVAFVSPAVTAVVSKRTASKRPGRLVLRMIDLAGHTEARLDAGSLRRYVELQGACPPRHLLALNKGVSGGTMLRGCFLDVRTGGEVDLPLGWVFPVGPYGNCQPFSPTGRYAIAHRLTRHRTPAWVVAVPSGKPVRMVPSLPTSHAPLIRWVGSDDGLRWFDRDRRCVGGEHFATTRQGARPFPRTDYAYAVLSMDASLLAAYDNSGRRNVKVEVYDTETGRSIKGTRWSVPEGQTISSVKWSPDNRYMAVALTDNATASGVSLYLLSRAGDLRKVALPGWRFVGFDNGVSWSTDGRRVVAVVYPESADLLTPSCRFALARVSIY